jgi:hypothetical protein
MSRVRAQGAQRAVASPDTSPGTRASHQGQRRRPWALRVEQQSRRGERELGVVLLVPVSSGRTRGGHSGLRLTGSELGCLERGANADAPETASNAKPLRASMHTRSAPELRIRIMSGPCQVLTAPVSFPQWRRSAALKRRPGHHAAIDSHARIARQRNVSAGGAAGPVLLRCLSEAAIGASGCGQARSPRNAGENQGNTLRGLRNANAAAHVVVAPDACRLGGLLSTPRHAEKSTA